MRVGEVKIDGHLLRLASVGGWRTADDRFSFYPSRDGWEIYADADNDREALKDAGISRVPLQMPLKSVLQICVELCGCVDRLKRPPTKYLIDGTPLTIRRQERQWIVKLRPNAGSLAWLVVYEELMDDSFTTRRALLNAVLDSVARHREHFAYVTLPPSMTIK